MNDDNPKRHLLPPHLVALALLVMAALHFFLPVLHVLPWPWNLTGLLPLAVGMVVFLLAAIEFRRAHTTIMPFKPSSALITSGMYRVTRNPIYLGMTFWLIGAAMLFGTLTPLFVWPGFVLVVDLLFVRAEERMLAERFGDSFSAYRQCVRRWI